MLYWVRLANVLGFMSCKIKHVIYYQGYNEMFLLANNYQKKKKKNPDKFFHIILVKHSEFF